MFSWPFRDYSYPWLQAAELLNIWHFGKTQKMLPHAALVNRCSLMGPFYCMTEQNIFKDLSFPEVPGLQKQQNWLYTGQAFVQV